MKKILLLSLALLSLSCSSDTPKDVSKKVDQLIAQDKYSQALDILDDANPDKTDANIPKLKEKAHLNYGLYFEYRGPKDSGMKDRMTSALVQYIEVLKLNPKNQKARSEIKQIMGVYSTMPDRSPGDRILKQLRDLGFDY